MSKEHIVIFGGLGNVGRALVRQSVAHRHPTTVAVRRPDALSSAFDAEVLQQVDVREVDSLDPTGVADAMEGADVAINAAGNSRDGELFLRICDVFMAQAERRLTGDKRVWLLGGLAAMDVPHTRYRGDDLIVPAPFKLHRHNRERLERSTLTWSMACPGPMVERYDEPLPAAIRMSVDEMPIDFPEFVSHLPKWLLTAVLLTRIRTTRVSYDDVAASIIERVRDSAVERRRVGFALPAGRV